MSLAIRLMPETLRSLAFGSISGTYAGIGAALANPSRILNIQNLTDVLLTFSFDGINDHLVLPSAGYIIIDITANRTIDRGGFTIAEGTRIYAKGSPSSGSVYLSTFYGAE